MRTQASEMFGLEFPVFAFSHCRDVVAAVSGLTDVFATSRVSTYGTAKRIAAEIARSDWNA